MLRTIGSVLLGYVVMFVVVFVLMSAAYLGLGAERAFRPGSYQVSASWAVISIVIGLAAAIAGGMVAARIGRSKRDPTVLAVVVAVLGLIMAIPTLSPPSDNTLLVRDASIGNLQAMEHAQTPPWIAFLNPVIGAAGVLLGARLLSKQRRGALPAAA